MQLVFEKKFLVVDNFFIFDQTKEKTDRRNEG